MTTASDDDPREIFPFFKLAGELRNNVYDNSVATIDTGTKEKRELIIVAEDAPPTHLLLICHQFKAEFEDRVKGRARLTISDTWGFQQLLCGRVLTPPTAAITTVHVNLLGSAGHTSWIETLLPELPNLKRLTITLIVRKETDRLGRYEEERLMQELIADIKSDECHDLPALQSFNAFYGIDNDSFCTDGMRKLLTFDPETRRLQSVDAAEVNASAAI